MIFTTSKSHITVNTVRMFGRLVDDCQILCVDFVFKSNAQCAVIVPLPILPASAGKSPILDQTKMANLCKDSFFNDLCFVMNLETEENRQVNLGCQLFMGSLDEFSTYHPIYRIPGSALNSMPSYSNCAFIVALMPNSRGKTFKSNSLAVKFRTKVENGQIYFPTAELTATSASQRNMTKFLLFYQLKDRAISGDSNSIETCAESVYTKRHVRSGLVSSEKMFARIIGPDFPNCDVVI